MRRIDLLLILVVASLMFFIGYFIAVVAYCVAEEDRRLSTTYLPAVEMTVEALGPGKSRDPMVHAQFFVGGDRLIVGKVYKAIWVHQGLEVEVETYYAPCDGEGK